MSKNKVRARLRDGSPLTPKLQPHATGYKNKPVYAARRRPAGAVVTLQNAQFRVEVNPEHGGALTSYIHKPTATEILWRNRYSRSPKLGMLDQPVGSGSDLYDVMDGSWYVSLPNGFFAGDYFGAPLGTHGELRSLPWEVESVRRSSRGMAATLRGASIRTPFVYHRELVVDRGSNFMHWRESIQNRSSEPLPIAWVHHPTFGGALLDGARLIAPARRVQVYQADQPQLLQLQAGYSGEWPWVPEGSGGKLRDCSLVPPKESGLDHSVQLSQFTEGWGSIWNENLRLGFSLVWDPKVFPYAWSWACSGGIKHYPLWGDGHIFTLQPSTSPVGRFADLLKSNSVLTIPGNGVVSTEMRTGFVTEPGAPAFCLKSR